MKQKILSLITAMALCLSLYPTWAFAAGPEPEEVDEASVPMPLADSYTLSGALTINSGNKSTYDNATITSNGETTDGYLVIDGVTVTLTISDLVTMHDESVGKPGIQLMNGANLTLKLQGSNIIRSSGTFAGINVPAGCTLTIEGTDSDTLEVISFAGGAGIGANYSPADSAVAAATVGTIIINGGNINAHTLSSGAGIGGTMVCTTGDVIINGGIVTASGSSSLTGDGASGIGAGIGGHLNSITINGGTVTAKGTSNSADIGAGPNGNPAGNPVMECGNITINGGTINSGTIGFGRTEDAALADRTTNSGVTVGENAELLDCTVQPFPEDCDNYTFNVTVYNTSITSDVIGTFAIDGKERSVTIAASGAEPYRGDFSVTILMPKRTSATATLTWDGGTASPTAVQTASTTVNVTFGTQTYQYFTINGTIHDTKITEDMEAIVTAEGQAKTVTMTYQAPYSGTFRVDKIALPSTFEDSNISVTVEAGGNTWNGMATGSGITKTLTIGDQEYKLYSLSGTIYDARITGDMSASVSFLGETYQVTLTKTADCCATFSLSDLMFQSSQADGEVPVTVTASGITWAGTAGSGTSKTLAIGTPLQKVRLIFWDNAITQELPVLSLKVTQGGTELGVEALASSGPIQMLQGGKGYIDLWLPAGVNTTIEVMVPALNGGAAIKKDGLTISADTGEIEMYEGESSSLLELDLSYGNITFTESSGRLQVTYSDAAGSKTVTNLSYSNLYTITQSNASTATGNRIEIKNTTQKLNICLKGVNISHEESAYAGTPPIDIGANCQVELRTSGENTISSVGKPAIHVPNGATLTLAGDGSLNASTAMSAYSGYHPSTIGSKEGQASGTIIIRSGTIDAKTTVNRASGAAIGGGYTGIGTVEIHGGTVNASNESTGAAIGGGDSGTGTVTITGGTVNASARSGAAIGAGTSGTGTVTITGGIVNATANSTGAGIGSGGTGTVVITGGIITAYSNGGAAIGTGSNGGAGTVTISGGTIKATNNKGNVIGTGLNGSGGGTTVTGGTIYAKGYGDMGLQSPKDGSGNDVSRVEITLTGVGDDVLITGAGDYGTNDVYTRDGGKLYFYLPDGTLPEKIMVDGVPYVPQSEGSTTYVKEFKVELDASYPLTKVYDGNALQLPTESQVTSGLAYDSLEFTWNPSAGGTTNPTDAGSYVLRVSDKNDPDTYKDFMVAITKRPLTITAKDQTITYGGSIQTGVGYYAISSGSLASGHSLSGITLSASKTDAGTYSSGITVSGVKISKQPAQDVTANYDITYVPGKLTINKAVPTINTWPTAASIRYGQVLADSSLTGGSASTAGTFSWRDGTVRPKAGTYSYEVVFTPADQNYETVSREISVAVEKFPLTITAKDQTITYGGSIVTGTDQITAGTLAAGDTLESIVLTPSSDQVAAENKTVTPSQASIKNAGGEDVTDCYEITYVPGTLTIHKATVTGSVDVKLNIANSLESTYTILLSNVRPQVDGRWENVSYEIEVNFTEAGYYTGGAEIIPNPNSDSGALNTLSLPVQFNEVETTGKVGTVTVTVKSDNYEDYEGTIDIMAYNKDKVTISGLEEVNSVYNGEPVTGYTGTLIATDSNGNQVDLELEISYTGRLPTSYEGNTPPVNVGTYAVIFRVPDDNPYYIGRTNVSFEITPAPVTVTADDKTARAGDEMPALTYTVSGLAGDDTLTVEPTLSCDADMNAIGTYPIVPSGAVISNPNYSSDILYVNGTLTVTEAIINVTGVTLDKTELSLETGGSARLTATVFPGNASNQAVSWTSSDPSVAVVDANGVVTAKGAGTAVITAVTADGNKTASCTVTVSSSSGYNPGGSTNPGGGGSVNPGGGNNSGSGIDPGSSTTTYTVAVEKPANGTVSSDWVNAASGSTVTLTVIPDIGYVLDTLTATDTRGNEIALTAQGDGRYTFEMPDWEVTVTATFVPLPADGVKPCDGGADCATHDFTDVGGVGTWYHEAVDYVLRNGLMNGYGNNLFGPDDNLSRAQLAQILYKKEGDPAVTGGSGFIDVASSEWYTPAITWASSNGIVDGYGGSLFGPDDSITREQLVVMLWRYVGSPSATNRELRFADRDQASDWALEALRWAAENGVINGYTDNTLRPDGLATRAQVAQMLMNLFQSLL